MCVSANKLTGFNVVHTRDFTVMCFMLSHLFVISYRQEIHTWALANYVGVILSIKVPSSIGAYMLA